MNLLRKQGAKITLIGDPDQCIYEFSMANAKWLPGLRKKWKIPELPLSKSFRCNNSIANAVRNIGGNKDFTGCGDPRSALCQPFVIREPTGTFSRSVRAFEKMLLQTSIDQAASAIVCRGHPQIESLRGRATYNRLKGETKRLAKASFARDCHKDYKTAFRIVESAIRGFVEDDDLWERIEDSPNSTESERLRLRIWQFVKSDSGLPKVTLSGDEWISQLRATLGDLIRATGTKNIPNLNVKIKKTGLDDAQMHLPLFVEETLFPAIRQETIHQVKGESIDAVLVLGSAKFWNSVVESALGETDSEDRRLAYVGMTRARHLLLIGLPKSHYDKHAEKWQAWGFQVASTA
jgi:hypothetical protein